MTRPRVLVDNWVMDAIEQAAYQRVMVMLYGDKKPFGLSLSQIRHLKDYYERSTGKKAHKIKGEKRKQPKEKTDA